MTNDQIKALIREVIEEGFEIQIPDEDIAKVVKTETAEIERRLAALEGANGSKSKVVIKPGPQRVNVLRERVAALNGKKGGRK